MITVLDVVAFLLKHSWVWGLVFAFGAALTLAGGVRIWRARRAFAAEAVHRAKA